MSGNRAGHHVRQRRDGLTRAELEVLQLIADGLIDAEVAERRWVSRETVKSHLRHIRTKLGVRRTVHAVAIAMRRGWIH